MLRETIRGNRMQAFLMLKGDLMDLAHIINVCGENCTLPLKVYGGVPSNFLPEMSSTVWE